MRFLPLIAVMAAIFLLSHTPGDAMPSLQVMGYDKLCHMLAYGVLASTALFAWHRQVKKRPGAGLLLILLFCLLYGISDELHQSFVPGRYASVGDIVADGLGAALFLAGWWLHQRSARQTAGPDKIA